MNREVPCIGGTSFFIAEGVFLCGMPPLRAAGEGRPLRRGRDDAARAAGAQEEEVPPLVNHPLFALDGARFAAAKFPLSGSLRKYGSLAGDRFA